MDQLVFPSPPFWWPRARNVGLTPVVKAGHPALTEGVCHTSIKTMCAPTLRAANSRLIRAQSGLCLAQRWGAGLLASVDGMRFVVPVATVNASYSDQVFGLFTPLAPDHINMLGRYTSPQTPAARSFGPFRRPDEDRET